MKEIKCLCCKEVKGNNNSNFYMNTNPLYSSERYEVCKSCLSSFIGEKDSDGYVDRVTLVLANMNKPFLEDLWISSGENWAKYIPQISSFHKKKTFADSTYTKKVETDISAQVIANSDNRVTVAEITLTPEDRLQYEMFWGKGFDAEDYLYLEDQYETLLSRYTVDSYSQEVLFQEIAHKLLEIRKLRESNKSTDKETKTLQDLLGSSNIKPVQETGASENDQAVYGLWIKRLENERPVPEPDPLWRDVDGILKYIKTWFLGHISHMMGNKNENSELYEKEIAKYTVKPPEYQGDET